MNTADKIVKLRTEKGLNQTEFSGLIGVTSGVISKIERGERLPSLNVLKKISEVFEVSISYLQDDDNSSQIDNNTIALYKEYERIVKFISSESFVRLDIEQYVEYLLFDAIDDCESIDVALRSLSPKQKKEIVFESPELFKFEYERAINQLFTDYDAYFEHIKTLDDNGISKILESNRDEFVKFMIKSNITKFKSVLKDLEMLFSKYIDDDMNINILLKHKILKPSDLTRLHVAAMELYKE